MGIRVFTPVLFLACVLAAQDPAHYFRSDTSAIIGFNFANLEKFAQEMKNTPGVKVSESKAKPDFPGSDKFNLSLDSLKRTNLALISMPDQFGSLQGSYDLAAIAKEARAKGMREELLNGSQLFHDPGKPKSTLALVRPDLLLIGPREQIAQAMERAKSPGARPVVLDRALRLSRDWDFFVAADKLGNEERELLPDTPNMSKEDLESIVAMDAGFRIRLGIAVRAVMTARTEEDAKRLAAKFQPDAQASQLGMAKVSRSGRVITTDIDVDFKALMEGMAKAMAEGLKQGFEEMGKEMQKGGPRKRAAAPVGGTSQVTWTAAPPPEPELPPEKRVVRIVGLDEGPREIPLLKPGEAKPAPKPPAEKQP